MYKNVASQKVAIYAWDAAAGVEKMGDAANITARISKDGAASVATNDVNPTQLDVALPNNITGITKANPGVVSSVAHALNVGDRVYFSGLTEMTELNGTIQTVSAVGSVDLFSINDTSGYGTAETTGGATGWTADHPGIYLFDLTQAETNADLIVITPFSSTADVVIKPIIATPTLVTSAPIFTSTEVDNDGSAIDFEAFCKLVLSVLTGKSSGGGGSTIVFRDVADSKNRISATVDSNGNRTAVGTRDGS